MKIILLISNNKEITDNISEFKPENLDFIVVKAEQYLSNYLEEYLPEYVIVNIPVKNTDLLNEYKKKNQTATIFLNNSGCLQENKNPKFIYIKELKNKNDVKNIVNIISKIEIENKNIISLNNYKLINQQVISVFSLKGGTGKTTVSFNLAYYIKRIFNAKVILIDLNFCEGYCDLASYLRSNQIPNISYYIENHNDGEESLWKSVIIKDNSDIDVLLPPLSLIQYNKINIPLLSELINLIRGFY
ncbi:AAA family ATPase, partial [bacterium]|nr:AAA family ATPase [bacterium]